ncbi:hypothetical protein SHIRM173S_06667 [Streptomyces hirsutus]
MISAQDFCDLLADRGFTLASGVPCSHFGGPIAHLSTQPGRHVPAPNEGSALAVAAGAALGGSVPMRLVCRTPVWATSSTRSPRW